MKNVWGIWGNNRAANRTKIMGLACAGYGDGTINQQPLVETIVARGFAGDKAGIESFLHDRGRHTDRIGVPRTMFQHPDKSLGAIVAARMRSVLATTNRS